MPAKYMTPAQMKKAVIPTMAAVTAIGLAFALYKFEQFNYASTKESLTGLFGQTGPIIGLAIAFVAVDVAAIWRIFTPAAGPNEQEPEIVGTLWKVWGAVTGVDAIFDWFYLSLWMQKTAVEAPEIAKPFLWILPIILAFVNWGIRFGLLYFFGLLVDRLVHGKLTMTTQTTTSVTKPSHDGKPKQPQPGMTKAQEAAYRYHNQSQPGGIQNASVHSNSALQSLFGGERSDQRNPVSGNNNNQHR